MMVKDTDKGKELMIQIKDLKKLNIALPSEKEQKIIGRYLYTIDQKISVNQAINDNLERVWKLQLL